MTQNMATLVAPWVLLVQGPAWLANQQQSWMGSSRAVYCFVNRHLTGPKEGLVNWVPVNIAFFVCIFYYGASIRVQRSLFHILFLKFLFKEPSGLISIGPWLCGSQVKAIICVHTPYNCLNGWEALASHAGRGLCSSSLTLPPMLCFPDGHIWTRTRAKGF